MRIFIVAGMLTSVAGLVSSSPASAQAQSQAAVPVRELSAPEAKSARAFGSILHVRPLPGEKVLINDPTRHQLLVLDSKLGVSKVVLDSSEVGGYSYGRGFKPLIPYLGDSTLTVDYGSVSLIMIHPDGTIGRTMAMPAPSYMPALSRDAGVDRDGNLLFKAFPAFPSRAAALATKDTTLIRQATSQPDSLLLLRSSFSTRTTDTIARFKAPGDGRTAITFENGTVINTSIADPLPNQDDYAILSDGSIALVRGHDYHVDVIQPDGKLVRGPKLPFDWKQLTEADKQRLVDSAKVAVDSLRAQIEARNAERRAGSGGGTGNAVRVSAARSAAGGGATQGVDAPSAVTLRFSVLSVSQVASYYPPIRSGALKSDMDANVWILPTTSAQSINGELLYDVVNNRGVLTQRVRIPAGRSIAGFGKGGIVYLMSRDANGWWLERTRINLK